MIRDSPPSRIRERLDALQGDVGTAIHQAIVDIVEHGYLEPSYPDERAHAVLAAAREDVEKLLRVAEAADDLLAALDAVNKP